MQPSSDLAAAFRAEFGAEPRIFSAPGRVNLIGEHTDYNDGFVLPIAIERRTRVAISPRNDRVLKVVARDLDERAEVDLDRESLREPSWMAYVEGVARVLESRGHPVPGANVVVESDVPIGAGLSSSAALEVAVGRALTAMADADLPPIELALAAQAAENEYAGTRCGIMDQYIATLGREDHALLIDCRSLEATPVAADFGSAVLLVCDSRVKHDLAVSAYNERRAQCELGVELLARERPDVRALRDVSILDIEQASFLSEVVRRRCRHVVTENARTQAAVAALRAGDLREMGRLMTESHWSLARDYEVSCDELDLLVETACSHAGVHGSRLTGAGFGGCAIALVERAVVGDVIASLESAARRRFGIFPVSFFTGASAGVREDRAGHY